MLQKIMILSFVVASTLIFSQDFNKDLIQYIKDADTILLASHEDLSIDTESKGKLITTHRTLLKNNRPNGDIIRKQLILNPELRQELLGVLKGQKKDKYWDGAFCFDPHNAIFIYKANKWENINLCFGCDHYNSTSAVPVNKQEFLFTYEDWRNMEAFFKKYSLDWESVKKKAKQNKF